LRGAFRLRPGTSSESVDVKRRGSVTIPLEVGLSSEAVIRWIVA
jgi:hypothetical protein